MHMHEPHHQSPLPPISSKHKKPQQQQQQQKESSLEPHEVFPGVIAGIAKSFATKSAFAITAFSKGLLKYWFKVPLKFFKPAAVNPYMVFHAMAAQDGQKPSFNYIAKSVKSEGFSLISKNMLPLLVANSIVGAVLFNTYSYTFDALSNSSLDTADPDSKGHYAHPFVAGAIAGAAQSIVSTPLDNLNRRINIAEIIASRKNEGVIGVVSKAIKTTLFVPSTTPFDRAKFLWGGLGLTATKDTVGFSLFFGVFESLRKSGKRAASHLHSSLFVAPRTPTATPPPQEEEEEHEEQQKRRKHPLSLTLLNVAAVIAAGSLAGISYQTVIYPIDRLPLLLAEEHERHVKEKTQALLKGGKLECVESHYAHFWERRKVPWGVVWRVWRERGLVGGFYKGIAAQWVRAAPPSAVGLLIFEIANSQLFDEED
ncbi:hypothetical protein HDV05_005007 [Chytridiales sp. JEL 0842]|nr:hypothetical protein HDV05_005007 [Chytridiales sp. JEL 0842]